jgi:ABC-type thiamine transport system ATPase subunit
VLKIRQLEFSYALADDADMAGMSFDLDVAAGEVLSLIGPSGSGKSTLLSLIAGFVSATSGQILVRNVDIQTLAPAQRPVTIVFQEHNLFPHLDLFTNVALGINPSLRLPGSRLLSLPKHYKNWTLADWKNAYRDSCQAARDSALRSPAHLYASAKFYCSTSHLPRLGLHCAKR